MQSNPKRRRMRALPALLSALFLTGCGHDLVKVKTAVVLPPEITCQSRPSVPAIDTLAQPDGDKALAVEIARLEDWGADCEDAVTPYIDWHNQHLDQQP